MKQTGPERSGILPKTHSTFAGQAVSPGSLVLGLWYMMSLQITLLLVLASREKKKKKLAGRETDFFLVSYNQGLSVLH